MDNTSDKRSLGLLVHFGNIFILFVVLVIALTGFVIYYVQAGSYKEQKCEEIREITEHLRDLMLEDEQDYMEYRQFFDAHCHDMRIPYEFDEYVTAREEFEAAFAREYPGLAFERDIKPSDMSYELQLLYYTYRHEYWIITFENALNTFGIKYLYCLYLVPETGQVVYHVDFERVYDEENPGYIYLGDEDNIYEDPDSYSDVMWQNWLNGECNEEIEEWDNEYGKTYSHYEPVVINGETISLVGAEIDVDNVNKELLYATVRMVVMIFIVLIAVVILLLLYINRFFISRITFLADKIDGFDSNIKSQIADEIRNHKNGHDEIGILAERTSDMLDELEAHETEVQQAAQMKTDFLANMSHEIRTPMNAVIGMAEMTLRDEIPDSARSNVSQIKSAGQSLLTIINDILDFSKIESGALEIIPVEYEPLSMFNDVANMIMTRLSDKPVSLDLDIDPDIPAQLIGDDTRIRQIVLNLANNAAKFTERGHVRLIVRTERTDDKHISMHVAVEDTGIGIHEEDLKKIFDSFSQVDSRRNRNVEGTGLGLAISDRLVKLMGGELSVQSVYGEGSVFSFTIDQEIANAKPAICVKSQDNIMALFLLSEDFEAECFTRDCDRLGVRFRRLKSEDDLEKIYDELISQASDTVIYLFIESRYMSPVRKSFLEKTPDVTGVMVLSYTSRIHLDIGHMKQLQKPISPMNIAALLNGEGCEPVRKIEEQTEFTAPEARVLIVDDNPVNLTIAEGLLEPLNMTVMTADSGRKAIEMAAGVDYDIVFMDHMMPEMDGVEAAHIMREQFPQYAHIPIIALTANAVSEARELLLTEGMDDFIPKPIEVKNLYSKVRQWLPENKIKRLSAEEKSARDEAAAGASEQIIIGDLDISGAINMLGNEKLFRKILKEYYGMMDVKAETIRKHYASEDWEAYTIEVHSLKSTSRQIGAAGLAQMAADLEKAGKAGDTAYIKAHTEEMLDKFISYKPVMEPYCSENEDTTGKPRADADTVRGLIAVMRTAAEDLDLDAMEAGMDSLNAYSYPDDQADILKELREAVSMIDTDTMADLLSKWEGII